MGATPDRARDVFVAAVKLDPGRRGAYLAEACGGDDALRGRVRELLAAHDAAGGFLEPPALGATAPFVGAAPHAAAELPGATVGPYRLLERLGEGGMGEVWVAEQAEPIKRRVALKLIKPGMDSRAVLARFEAERQALAIMDHPNIAKVLDAGTTADGRPYFVMELVKGTPITAFCDERRLSPRERLELFVPVCQAIQHAHHKGIIHRDVKPTNVLVALHDDRPVPKVIDFGVAKAVGQQLTEKTLYTGYGTLVGTPAYMAPEQATFNQLDIDTRADIYSLGVLLYELLAGSPPLREERLRKAALDEVLRVVREEEPPRPSDRLSTSEARASIAAVRRTEPARLATLLRGELDWVVMKALEKDRDRRYETVNGFAADVQRYLAGEAVLAVPPSTAYQLRKFVRRNKGPVLTACLVLVALLGSVVGVGFGMTEAWKHREVTAMWQQAESARGDAEKAREGEETARRKAEEAWGKLASFEYGRTVQMARQEWRDNNVPGALALLAGTREDLRGWEWHYVNRLCHSDLVTLPIDTHGAFALNADWTRVVTGAPELTAVVRDTRTGAQLLTLPHRLRQRPPTAASGGWSPYTLVSVTWSPDGSRIVTASYDGAARVWDVKTGKQLLVLATDDYFAPINTVAFSPDGSRIVTEGDQCTARIWDATNGAQLLILKGHTGWVRSAAFSPDGSRIVTASYDRTAKVWDAKTGEIILTLTGHTEALTSAAYAPDGSRIVTTSSDATAVVWDARRGTRTLTFNGHTAEVESASFSSDGSRVVTASRDLTARVWDATSGAELLSLRGHTKSVVSAVFSPDGSQVLTTSHDRTAKLWDTKSEYGVLTLNGHVGPILNASPSADWSRIVTGGSADCTARVWDTKTGRVIIALKEHVSYVDSASLSPDGSRVVTGTRHGVGCTWDVKTGEKLLTLTTDNGPITITSFSPDGSRVLIASNTSRRVQVWDAKTGKELSTLQVRTGRIVASAWRSDGLLVLTTEDNMAKLWDAMTGIELHTFTGHTDQIQSAAFSRDGSQIVTTSSDKTARVWDTETGRELVALKGHTHFAGSVAFSADGSRVVTGSLDRTARVWNARTGTELLTLTGHTEQVDLVSFSPDGSRVLTGSPDRTVRVWDSKTGAEVLTLKEHTRAIVAAVWSPDGSRVLTAGDTRVKIWDASPVKKAGTIGGKGMMPVRP